MHNAIYGLYEQKNTFQYVNDIGGQTLISGTSNTQISGKANYIVI